MNNDLTNITVEKAYEWVAIGRWSFKSFKQWHDACCQLAYSNGQKAV